MNTLIYKSKLHAAASALAIAAMVFSLVPMQAFAQSENSNAGGAEDKKVIVCKANQSGTGFTGKISVALNSINKGLANSGQNGDIVPPGTEGYPDGQNWTRDYNGVTGE